MANAHRGEVEAVLDGKTFRLCLTLGALAELEAAFGDDDMLALAARFEGGRLSARDCVRIIGAGLRGAGYEIADTAVSSMRAETGAAGYVDAVARLLRAGIVQTVQAVGGLVGTIMTIYGRVRATRPLEQRSM